MLVSTSFPQPTTQTIMTKVRNFFHIFPQLLLLKDKQFSNSSRARKTVVSRRCWESLNLEPLSHPLAPYSNGLFCLMLSCSMCVGIATLSYRDLEEMMQERGVAVESFDAQPLGLKVCSRVGPPDSPISKPTNDSLWVYEISWSKGSGSICIGW